MLKVKFKKDHARGLKGTVTSMREAMAEPMLEDGTLELIKGKYKPEVKEVKIDPNRGVMSEEVMEKKISKKKAKKKAAKEKE